MSTERAEKDTVSFLVREKIAWVSFNRPEKRNCMSPKLNRRMMEVLDELEFRDDVGVLILRGEGSAWSAGMDLKEYFRETEARAAALACGVPAERLVYMDLRFYRTGTIAKAPIHPQDIDDIVALLERLKPAQIYVAFSASITSFGI